MSDITEKLIQDYIIWKFHSEVYPNYQVGGEYDDWFKNFILDVETAETMRIGEK